MQLHRGDAKLLVESLNYIRLAVGRILEGTRACPKYGRLRFGAATNFYFFDEFRLSNERSSVTKSSPVMRMAIPVTRPTISASAGYRNVRTFTEESGCGTKVSTPSSIWHHPHA
jgi:hypothetical protein